MRGAGVGRSTQGADRIFFLWGVFFFFFFFFLVLHRSEVGFLRLLTLMTPLPLNRIRSFPPLETFAFLSPRSSIGSTLPQKSVPFFCDPGEIASHKSSGRLSL